jgi:small subunit ribosomal protein S9
MKEMEKAYYATGRRKHAVARTWVKPGSGKIIINGRELENYFPTEAAQIILKQPLTLTNTLGTYDVNATVRGGGISGQVGALRHGITRALIAIDPDMRPTLKKAGFVKRDPRVKERKKYGQRGARARFQFSKR